MINLGRKFFIFLCIPQILFGAVEALVDKTTVEEGDVVTLKIEISGDKALKPQLDSICQSKILAESTHSSYVIRNGVYKNNYTLTYQFVPEKSCTIEPIEIDINGKIEKTKPIKIEVKPVVYTKDSLYILEIKSSKKELYVGEEFAVDLYFKQKNGTNPIDSAYTPPGFQGFWVKKELPAERFNENEYLITKGTYILAAQREGESSITPAKINIKTREFKKDMYGYASQQITQKIYSSNQLDFKVKPLPAGVRLIGDFTLDVTSNKNQVEANEPIELTIKIVGEGNFEDIGSLRPYISGVNIFEEKQQIVENTWTQKLTLVADHNFTIAPITLEYFNPKTSKVEQLTTQAIDIEVRGQKEAPKLEIEKGVAEDLQKAEVQTEVNPIYFFVGLVLGLVIGFFLERIKPWKRKKSAFSIKDPKVLLMKLVPYKEDKDVEQIIEDLENHIYKKELLKIDKKLLQEIIKKYNLF